MEKLPPTFSKPGSPLATWTPKSPHMHWRWACPKFVRQTFHEWAAHSIASSSWAKAYYEQQRAKGKSRHTATRSLAFKWIRVIYRCWKDRTPYDEAKYLAALRQKGSPVLAYLKPQAAPAGI